MHVQIHSFEKIGENVQLRHKSGFGTAELHGGTATVGNYDEYQNKFLKNVRKIYLKLEQVLKIISS